jgi:hypothetical protein
MVTIRTTPTVARFTKQERLGEATSYCISWIATVKSYFYSAGQVVVQLPLISKSHFADVVTGIAAVTGGGSRRTGATIVLRKIVRPSAASKLLLPNVIRDHQQSRNYYCFNLY